MSTRKYTLYHIPSWKVHTFGVVQDGKVYCVDIALENQKQVEQIMTSA